MVVVMQPQATQQHIAAVDDRLTAEGFRTQVIYGEKRTVVAAVGDRRVMETLGLEALPGVEKVVPIMKPFKLASREVKEENTVIRVKGASVGGSELAVIAGPCAVESREQLLAAAWAVRAAGAKFLRGGAFKPRTSPYSFQGMEEQGLKLLAEASELTGLVTVSEVIDEESLAMALDYIDILQIGARNMQNFRLLKAAGKSGKPILLKRGLSATVEEWLMAAEYIMSEGNQQVILCERGIRTFETYTRNTLDLSAVPLVMGLSHLPVVVDPSHATGKRDLVLPMAMAAVAAGAGGLLVEMHPEPARALCDGQQSLSPREFAQLMTKLKPVAKAVGKSLWGVGA
ncbi:3-deoxy-7-phosphoheptulonate synthase [Desulforamulus hydrothermalis]|uniref:Phospho-2-dehydro-3-deoxyheptonate aldolase n=1 Tax=Desulforamulus hydrothermalis Lam5 = DSM 18033 TaxID=1121428 RepID=K8E090_9FIRM|nr:3-deoxy-7-phosphoheptulonate synthase [Desulforamulus hydrothermalis]CCO08902.1 Phospho-2-dehydro-3-deoxyheptonate aldolase [Desulforamulus hydrothermalis Lam5 = DSM 18033]SHG74347.1 3-deoxy-D-arabinoheptulosonate-7-phosphate synthase [Desulforamulus hydrothermalis Lam5 = DSM 18033]